MDVELGDIRGQGGIAVGGSDKMLWDREASWRRWHLIGGLSTRYLGNRGRSGDSITDETEVKRKGRKHGENNNYNVESGRKQGGKVVCTEL